MTWGSLVKGEIEWEKQEITLWVKGVFFSIVWQLFKPSTLLSCKWSKNKLLLQIAISIVYSNKKVMKEIFSFTFSPYLSLANSNQLFKPESVLNSVFIHIFNVLNPNFHLGPQAVQLTSIWKNFPKQDYKIMLLVLSCLLRAVVENPSSLYAKIPSMS